MRADLRVLHRIVKIISRAILAVRNALKLSVPKGIENVIFGVGEVRINRHSVRVGNDRRIVRALHSALDLKGVNACLDKLGDVVNRAHILGGHYKRAEIGLLDRDRQIGALFLVNYIVPTAGLGASATVSVTLGHKVGEHTSSAVRHAHRAVNKGFKLDSLGERSLDRLNFIKAKLASQHKSLCAESRISQSRLG